VTGVRRALSLLVGDRDAGRPEALAPERARTPREYLALLEEGSTRQQTLLGLTRIFERIWYGLRPAAKSDYERAKSMLEELRAA